jgi:hypothetical protein
LMMWPARSSSRDLWPRSVAATEEASAAVI